MYYALASAHDEGKALAHGHHEPLRPLAPDSGSSQLVFQLVAQLIHTARAMQ